MLYMDKEEEISRCFFLVLEQHQATTRPAFIQAVAFMLALSASGNILTKASAGDCTGYGFPLAT